MNSRFQQFKDDADVDVDRYRQSLIDNGTFEYAGQVEALQKLANKLSQRMMVYMFGETLGYHLMMKYSTECNRDLLQFFNKVTYDVRFFMLHELKNNKDLFIYS